MGRFAVARLERSHFGYDRVAVGRFAVGGLAVGGLAVGRVAVGGLAAGRFAMGGRAVVVGNVGIRTVTALPSWRFVVRAVAACAVGVLVVAGIDIAHSGLVHPWVALVGLAGTAFVNRLYVVMTQRGNVLEAID